MVATGLNATQAQRAWEVIFGPVRVNGSELGTSASDIYLRYLGIKESVCQALNKELIGSTTIPRRPNTASVGQYEEHYRVNRVAREHDAERGAQQDRGKEVEQ